MNEALTIFIRRKIIKEILWKAFKITLILVPILFFWVLSLNHNASNIFLFWASALVLLVLFITIPRWRRYYLTQYNYASKFAVILEKKTKGLTYVLTHLYQDPLPKEIFWVNFKIDPTTLKIGLEIYSTSQSNHFEDICNEIEALISVSESAIADLKMKGWDGEDSIELYIEMIRKWIYNTWSRVPLQKRKLRSTISIKDRSGYFNMTRNKWEEQTLLS